MAARKKRKGERVRLLQDVSREGMWRQKGMPGTKLVQLKRGERYTAATDEIGGNIFIIVSNADGDLIVPLAEGEWE